VKRASAVILAGGQGKRMGILCQYRPKPALPFAGRFRVIDFSLSNCIHSGIDNIAVLIDFWCQIIADYLDGGVSWLPIDPEKLHILEPKTDSYKGTADAVYQNREYLRRSEADRILILAGDHVYKMDYRKMLAFHEQVAADVTVGVVSVPIEQAHRFGMVNVSAEGRIIDFAEKPRIPATNLASMGIYIFNREVLLERLAEDAAQPSSPHDFGYAVIPKVVASDNVFAYEFNSYWQDIGTPGAYYEANMELTHEMPSFSLDGKWHVFTKDNSLPSPEISQQGSVQHSLIGPGCIVGGKVENSVLSPGVTVEEQAVVRNSLIMSKTTIGKHSVVDRCILDEEVNIGKFCYIGFGTSLNSRNRDITILGRSVTVPPHTAIGSDCEILPDVGPADFTTNTIPSGAVVSQH